MRDSPRSPKAKTNGSRFEGNREFPKKNKIWNRKIKLAPGNLEPLSSTDRQASPSERILKNKDVLESQDADLEKSQGKHITKLLFKGCRFF